MSPSRIRFSIATAALSVAAALLPAAAARQDTLDDLRGTWSGTFTSNNGHANGNIKLKIKSDKAQGSGRVLKADVSFGSSKFHLLGGYAPNSMVVNMTGASGRPPRLLIAGVGGTVSQDAKTITGGFGFGPQSDPDTGTFTASRP